MRPNASAATRMCYRDPDEKYNDGSAFKLTCRTEAGMIVTLIADNYFGYCKKEVKTQISYAANLMGNVEEEHAGGTLAFPSWSLGDEFQVNSQRYNGRTFADVERDYARFIEVQPKGYGVDRFCEQAGLHSRECQSQLARPEDSLAVTMAKSISIPLEPNKVYMAPSGYKLAYGKAPLGTVVAIDRYQCRGHRLPQAVHGERWWQE